MTNGSHGGMRLTLLDSVVIVRSKDAFRSYAFILLLSETV
ncbi:hypothetical protein SR187_0955 [Streptococcus ruminantium]|uniref:Uncharacterized protein n=1 Tax=Streptococcus ruminantium TaxID=1917441 RepID=A0A2Z5TTP1_9STRE|nr:hypothetical protein SR187_0955 [Streptococcus ruminantium]